MGNEVLLGVSLLQLLLGGVRFFNFLLHLHSEAGYRLGCLGLFGGFFSSLYVLRPRSISWPFQIPK